MNLFYFSYSISTAGGIGSKIKSEVSSGDIAVCINYVH